MKKVMDPTVCFIRKDWSGPMSWGGLVGFWWGGGTHRGKTFTCETGVVEPTVALHTFDTLARCATPP